MPFYRYEYFQEQVLSSSPPQSHCPAPGMGLVSSLLWMKQANTIFQVHLSTRWVGWGQWRLKEQ